jgi:hypothetical protein
MEAPVLISPDYSKDFLIFSFSSPDTVAVVLLQTNKARLEQPIAYFSRALRDAKVRYDIMEKQAYALVKALKYFRTYVLQSKIIAYIPSAVVKDILIQPDINERRSKWMAKILEFDLEIRPTKLIKGQGLAKLLVEANCKALGVDSINECSENQQDQLSDIDPQEEPSLARCPWFKDVIYFLQELQPPDGLQRNKARALKLKAIRYYLVNQVLYWKDPRGVLLKCMNPQEADRIMVEFHDSQCGGHHFWKSIAYKILRDRYYWPTVFTDVYRKVRACIKCQIFVGKQQLKSFPLKHVVVSGPF